MDITRNGAHGRQFPTDRILCSDRPPSRDDWLTQEAQVSRQRLDLVNQLLTGLFLQLPMPSFFAKLRRGNRPLPATVADFFTTSDDIATLPSLYPTSTPVMAEQQQPPVLPARSHQDGSPFAGHQQVDRGYREPELETSRPLHADRSRSMPGGSGSVRRADQPRRERSADMRRDAWNIDGRVEEEEQNWWDPAVRKTHNRPGPGMLPDLLENYLHDPDHILLSVSPSPQARKRWKLEPFHADFPSTDEIRRSIPHPNAYYCPKDNGWVLLYWEYSVQGPPLSKLYHGPPLPDLIRRSRVYSCLGPHPLSTTRPNETHHFHYYKAAVDGSRITEPSNLGTPNHDSDDPRKYEGDPLDLFICCQCTLYFVVSDVIPSVIPQEIFEAFVRDKVCHPDGGQSPAVSLVVAIDTFME
jgi:hypothetical protein